MAVTSDNSLEILIKTRAELEGAESVAASLERQIGKAKALGKDYSALDAQLKQVTQSVNQFKAKQQDLGEAHKEAGKHAEFLGLKHANLHKLVHQLGEAFPIAGMAGRAFMNPVMLALSLAIGVFVKAKEHLAELNAEMDKASEAAAKPVVSLEQMKDAMNATADDVYKMRVEYEKWTKALNERSGETTTNLTAETTALTEQVTAAKDLIEAKKALALQRIDDDQSLTPEQKALRKFQVESAAGTTTRNMDIDAGRVGVANISQAFREVTDKFADKMDDVKAAKGAAEDFHRIREIKSLTDQIASAKQTKADEDALSKKALDKYDVAKTEFATVKKAMVDAGVKDPSHFMGDQQEALDQALAEVNKHQGLGKNAERLQQESSDHLARLTAEQTAATDSLAKLKGEADRLQAEFNQLSIALDRAQRHQETAEKSATDKAPIELAKRIAEGISKAPGAAKALAGGEAIAENARTGRPVSDKERQALIQLASQIAGRPLSFDQSRDYFGRITDRPGIKDKADVEKNFFFALERITERMEASAKFDRDNAANAAAHPGAGLKKDVNERFKQGLSEATGEVEKAVTQAYLDATTEIRALAKRIEANTKKHTEGMD